MSGHRLNPAIGNARLALDILAGFKMHVSVALLCSHLVERKAFRLGGTNPAIKRTRTLLLQLLDAGLVVRSGPVKAYQYAIHREHYQNVLDGVYQIVVKAAKAQPSPIKPQHWYSGLGEIA